MGMVFPNNSAPKAQFPIPLGPIRNQEVSPDFICPLQSVASSNQCGTSAFSPFFLSVPQ